MSASVALYVALTCLALVVFFQLALALGAPWGALAMGGRYPGRYPRRMRIAALVSIGLYAAFGLILAVRAGALWPDRVEAFVTPAWVVTGVLMLSVMLNLVTPSRWERRLWAPVALLLAAASLRIALD